MGQTGDAVTEKGDGVASAGAVGAPARLVMDAKAIPLEDGNSD